MTATKALAEAKDLVIRLDEIRVAAGCATTTAEIDKALDSAAQLCSALDALVADATGTAEEIDELRHWQRRGGSHLSLAKAAGAQSWSQITKRGCVR